MKNFVQPGNQLTLVAPYAVASGAGCLVGSLFGVAVGSALIGASVEVALSGVYTLAKATGAAWTQGQRIYWDDVAKNCTGVVGTNKLVGVATAAAAAGDAIGDVLLTSAFTI